MIECFFDCSSPWTYLAFHNIQKLAKKFDEPLSWRPVLAGGIFNAVNNVVSQSVPHLHVHVVPRRHKDGLRGFFWPRSKYASEEEAQAVAASIRRRL